MPQAALILFIAPFDPLLREREMIYITMETPIANTKKKTKMPQPEEKENKIPSSFGFDPSSQM